MEWSHDFCLSCDSQISQSEHGVYCSQSCRLADLERASASSVSSSSYASTSSQTGHGSGFFLPPALNFSSMSPKQPSSSPTARSSLHSHYSSAPQHYASERTPKLYSSPSRTSLSSEHSYNGQHEPTLLSTQVQNELREYAGSFDHIRDWKRKVTLV